MKFYVAVLNHSVRARDLDDAKRLEEIFKTLGLRAWIEVRR